MQNSIKIVVCLAIEAAPESLYYCVMGMGSRLLELLSKKTQESFAKNIVFYYLAIYFIFCKVGGSQLFYSIFVYLWQTQRPEIVELD